MQYLGKIRRLRDGFSLMELIVVVMILGVIASIAAPRLLGMSGTATDQGLRHTLSVVRDAIDRFAADLDGVLPGADGVEQTFKDDLSPYLRGRDFPFCPVGSAKNNSVRLIPRGTDRLATIAASTATHSWLYNYETGAFLINSRELSSDGATTYDEF